MSLTLEMDVAEPRILRDRLVVSCDGSRWDTNVGASWTSGATSNVLVDPVTRTAMLRPLQLSAAWRTTFTGNYARLTKADYTLITAAAWVENNRTAPGDTYLVSLGTSEVVTTASALLANQGVCLSVFVPGVQTLGDHVILECGWGVPGAAGTVALRVAANGDVDLYKGQTRLARYDNTGKAFVEGGKKSTSLSPAQRTITLCLIPMPRRSLLVLTDDGDGFCHTFEDLDQALTNNIVTPAGTFFWRVPIGQSCVQMSLVKYAASGTLYGPVNTLRYPPATGQTFPATFASDNVDGTATTITAGLYNPDLTGFTPNGTLNQVRLGVTLAGNTVATPFLYAVDMVSPRTTTTTASQPFDLFPYVKKLTLSVPEHEAATLEIVAKSPAAMEAAGLEKARIIGDRPLRLTIDGIDIFRGTAAKPSVTEGIGHSDALTEVSWKCTDRDLQFLLYSFRDTFPYDGLGLSATVQDLVTTAGFATGDTDITADTFVLPFANGDAATGKFQLLPGRGDTVGMWLKRLWQDYAATWLTGWTPTLTGYKYRFRRPDTLSATPSMEMFETTEAAQTFGILRTLLSRRTVRAMRATPETPAANQVLVVGYDARTGTYLQSQYDDAASQAPGTLPSARPDNWRGQLVSYQIIDPQGIASQANADRARDILRDRATQGRDLWEIDCDFLQRATDNRPLWKGDIIRIYKGASGEGVGTGARDFRILAIPTVDFIFEGDGTRRAVRQATYHLLRVA